MRRRPLFSPRENPAISTRREVYKHLCGLAKTKQKEIMGAHGRYAGNLTPEKADAIREALIQFGIIESG